MAGRCPNRRQIVVVTMVIVAVALALPENGLDVAPAVGYGEV